jgi:predicted Fe-Mo cluster-binding NifX family protein
MSGPVRIAVASDDGRGLDAPVSGHFGRCPHYTIVTVDGEERQEVSVVENPYFDRHTPGAVPRFLAEQRAAVVLTGGMGPRAAAMFEELGIRVATGAVGTVGEAVDGWLRGEIRGFEPCAHDHPRSCGGHGEGRGGQGRGGRGRGGFGKGGPGHAGGSDING